MVKAGNQLWS